VLLASGLSEIEKQLEVELKNSRRCYHRAAVVDVAKSYKPDVAVLSAHLPGDDDLVEEVVKPLRARGVRVVFLPGDVNMPDCREMIVKLVPLGVYCYVYDPVLPGKIVYRLENPGTLGDLPAELAAESLKTEEAKAIGQKVVADIKAPEPRKKGIINRLSGTLFARTKNLIQERAQSRDAPEPAALTGTAETPVLNALWFNEYGSVENLLAADLNGKDAIIVPADTPDLLAVLQNLRRSVKLNCLPVVVLGDCDQAKCYQSGADECANRLDESLCGRIRARASRLREMWEKANRDELTGAYKRSFIEEFLKEQSRRHTETGAVFSVALTDLDRFKEINDTHGHGTGDELLKGFVAFLTGSLRQTDLVSRWGGDEFLIVFPRAGPKEAAGAMERLRLNWSQERVVAGVPLISTFTAGVAAYDPSRDIIADADRALYRAKEKGRNRIEIAGETSSRPDPAKTPVVQPPTTRVVPTVKLHSRVITLCSPWTPGVDTASLSILLARSLARRKIAVALVDADFKGAEVGLKLGIPLDEVWKYDWRREPVALSDERNFFALILDPHFYSAGRKDFRPMLREAVAFAREMGGIGRIVVNAGDDPEVDVPGDRILVVSEKEVNVDVIDAWRFYRPFDRGGVLIGGNLSLAEKFNLPALGTFDPDDLQAAANSLIQALL
jgi:diguanylate cyclase (GGDEF)-like protein